MIFNMLMVYRSFPFPVSFNILTWSCFHCITVFCWPSKWSQAIVNMLNKWQTYISCVVLYWTSFFNPQGGQRSGSSMEHLEMMGFLRDTAAGQRLTNMRGLNLGPCGWRASSLPFFSSGTSPTHSVSCFHYQNSWVATCPCHCLSVCLYCCAIYCPQLLTTAWSITVLSCLVANWRRNLKEILFHTRTLSVF